MERGRVGVFFPHALIDATFTNRHLSTHRVSFQDAKKWVWALMEAKRWMADRAKEGGVGAAAAHNNNAEDAASHDINNVDEAGGGRDSQDSWDDDLNAVISNSRTASVEFGNNENLGPSHSSTAVAAGGLQLSANQFVIRRSMENLTLSSPNQTGRNSKCAEPISSTDKSVIPILDQESGSTSTHGRAGSRASGSDGIPLIQNSSNTSFQTARGGEEPHLPPVHYHLPSTSTDDFQTLVYLLNVQMDVQQRVIESVVEAISKTNKRSPSSNLITGINNGSPSSSPSTSSSSSTPPLSTSAADINMAELKGMPSLLSSSSSQIFSTIEKIVKLSEARDLKWMKRCKKEREGRLRWEEVVRVVLDGNDVTDATKEKASALALKAASIGGNTTSTTMPPPITSTGLPSTSTSILSPSDDVNHVGLPFSSSSIIGDGEDSEIFYDAPDETRFSIENNRSQFLEQVFGFPSSSSREDRSCLPSSAAVVDASISTTTTQHSTFHAEQPQSSPSPTISSSMLEKSIVGYNPPSKNSKLKKLYCEFFLILIIRFRRINLTS